MASLGANLRRLRDAHGLTQERLAELAGVSRPTIAALEINARTNCDTETVSKLAAALGENVGEFFRGPAPARRVRRKPT